MSDIYENKGALAATIVVAASNSLNRAAANYVCDGINDEVEIQAALDALPDTGGEVLLLDGTYNIEVSLVLDSYQTLRGCGRNTILTTTTANLDILTATGADGSEKVGILIADLCIDGGATNDIGIRWTYVNYSKIESVWSQNNDEYGIFLDRCDFNNIVDNICQGNWNGIYLMDSSNNIIIGNTFQGNLLCGVLLDTSKNNTVVGNVCQGNDYGIYLSPADNNTVTSNTCQENIWGIYLENSHNNTIVSNTCQRNSLHGICLEMSDHNNINSNTCLENSAGEYNTDDNIYLTDSDYNLIEGNLCRAPTIGTTLSVGEPIGETEVAVTNTAGFEVGIWVVIDLGGINEEYHRIIAITAGAPGVIVIDVGLTNAQGAGETIDVPEARYGINISNAACNKNVIVGNDLYDAGKTANFNDVGTCTIVTDDNRDIEITQIKHLRNVKNTSGGALAAGNVVILKAVAAGNEIDTTAVLGNDKVYGMVAEAIADAAFGYVLVEGKTIVLSASNDHGNIAIGDFLCCNDTATECCLAAAGDMAFAIALEACAAANCVLDALLIKPRKI